MDVKQMFDDIAPTYDALNHILSLGIDRGWRRRVVGEVRRFAATTPPLRDTPPSQGGEIRVLDVATGTGDLAIALARALPSARVVGVDISEGMLAIGRRKVGTEVEMKVGAAEELPFPDESFDCVTAAFGVRNFDDRERGLSEMCRVLRPGGVCLVLEFSEPRSAVFGRVYRWYFHRVLPFLGRVVSRNRGAYAYLPRSVGEFPTPEMFSQMMLGAGFASVTKRSLTGGVAYIYKGIR